MNVMKSFVGPMAIVASFAVSANASISDWQDAAASHPNNVTNSTNGGAGYTLAGAGIAYDYGDLSNGNVVDVGPGAAVEFIFNFTNIGDSIALGGTNGYDNSEQYNFKLEQWSQSGFYGISVVAVKHFTFLDAPSDFDTMVHVVFVNRVDGKMEIYLDGVSKGVDDRANGLWVTNGGSGHIGSLADNPAADAATGTMYGVASYDAELSSIDVANLYAALTGTASPERSSMDLMVVHPSDHGKALVNPEMGWAMHFYSNIIANYGSKLEASDTLDDFPGLSTVYLRLPWSFIEPEEGRFDWSVIDTPAQRWIAKGKKVAFRITCSESWMRYATPKWVKWAGAKGNSFTPLSGIDPDGPFWEPVYDDPVFLEKFDRFLAEFARRYDDNPNVAFIDVGSVGVWGEGHTQASTNLAVADSVRQQHIDLHLKHFKNTLIAVSDDFIGPSNPVASHPLMDYMLQHGVTLRDDSICVQPPPYSWFHSELAQPFWPVLPVVLEHEHYGSSIQRNAWQDGELLVESVEQYHAAYMSIHWWPHEFLEKNREVIERINRRLGYRLQVRELSWPKQVELGAPLQVRAVCANVGVAPCYPGGYLALTLKDAKGGIVSVHVLDRLNLRDLNVGPPEQAPTRTVRQTFRFAEVYDDGPRQFQRAATTGIYDVFISVGQRDGTPTIALPLEGDDGQRRYKVGQILVTSP